MPDKRITPITYLLIAILAMLLLHFLVPGLVLIPMPWNVLGILPLGIGLALNLAADNALRKAGTTVKPFEESRTLVTNGVYRVSRHPMYLGFMLILAGVAILIGSLTPWAIIVIFPILMDRHFIEIEEHMLAERFGQTWQEYKRRTRRWL